MNYDKLKHNVKEFLLEYFDYMARITEPTVEDYKINDELMYDDMILSVDIFIDIKYIVVSLTTNFGIYQKYEKILNSYIFFIFESPENSYVFSVWVVHPHFPYVIPILF